MRAGADGKVGAVGQTNAGTLCGERATFDLGGVRAADIDEAVVGSAAGEHDGDAEDEDVWADTSAERLRRRTARVGHGRADDGRGQVRAPRHAEAGQVARQGASA